MEIEPEAEIFVEPEPDPEPENAIPVVVFKGSKYPQILAALTVCIGAFITGNMVGWSSPAIPNLEIRRDFGDLTTQEKSWIGSITTLSATMAGVFAGYLIERVGRKNTLMIFCIPFLLGWPLLAGSVNVPMMLTARAITGFSGGAFTLIIPVYISEIAEDSVRGTLGSLLVLLLGFGIVFVYIMGAYISWIWLSVMCSVFPVLMLIGVYYLPETPTYLVSKSRLDDARESLIWLRGASTVEEIEPKLKLVQNSVEENMASRASLKDLLTPSILKPLVISMAIMFFQQFGGINAVLFYSVDIFNDAGSDIDPNLSSVIIATIQVVFVGVSTILIDRAGRKILLIISEIGMAISLAALGAFFYVKEEQNGGTVPDGLGWLPLVSLIVYIIMYNIAMGPVPWIMMSELLPSRVKGLASAIVSSLCWFLAFLVTKNFEDLSLAIHSYGCYWLFSGLSMLGAIFAIFIIPETKGKSLDEIQAMFTKSKSRR